MKCCGTDSATVKAASKEGIFLMQIEVLSSSGVISTSHEAQSIFSARPNPGPCLSAITRAEALCLMSPGPS